jgi:hypothetical protein
MWACAQERVPFIEGHATGPYQKHKFRLMELTRNRNVPTFSQRPVPKSIIVLMRIQADLGIPPLMFYQTKQLAYSHSRLTNSHKHSIPGQIYAVRTHNLRHLQQTDLENRIIRGYQTVLTEWSPPEPLPQPKYLERVSIQNREKSFGRSLHAPLSNIWRMQLRPQPCPHGAYSAYLIHRHRRIGYGSNRSV